MISLTVDIPDDLAGRLEGMAVSDCCRRALEAAVAERDQMRAVGREVGEELLAQVVRLVDARQNSSGKQFYTLAETAEILRTSTDTVRRMIDHGELDCIRWGRRVLVADATIQHLKPK